VGGIFFWESFLHIIGETPPSSFLIHMGRGVYILKADSQEVLNMISTMDSETISNLIKEAWVLYDEAVLRETGHLYNLGSGDPHWEGHL
jgi:hypothetical protein